MIETITIIIRMYKDINKNNKPQSNDEEKIDVILNADENEKETIVFDGSTVKRLRPKRVKPKVQNEKEQKLQFELRELRLELEKRKRIDRSQLTKIVEYENVISELNSEKDRLTFAKNETHAIPTSSKGTMVSKIKINTPMYGIYIYKNVSDSIYGIDKNNVPFLVPGLEKENTFIVDNLERSGLNSDGVYILETYTLPKALEFLNSVNLNAGNNLAKETEILEFLNATNTQNNSLRINTLNSEQSSNISTKLRNSVETNPDIEDYVKESLLSYRGYDKDVVDIFTTFYTGLERDPIFTIVTFISIEEIRRKKNVYVSDSSLAISIDKPLKSFPKPVMHIGGNDIAVEYFSTDKNASSKFYALHGNIVELKPIYCPIRKEVEIAFKDYITSKSKTISVEEKDFQQYSIYNTEAEAFLDRGRESSLASMIAVNDYKELINKAELTEYNRASLISDRSTKLSEIAYATFKLQSEEKMLEMKRDMSKMNLSISKTTGVTKIIGEAINIAKLIAKYL